MRILAFCEKVKTCKKRFLEPNAFNFFFSKIRTLLTSHLRFRFRSFLQISLWSLNWGWWEGIVFYFHELEIYFSRLNKLHSDRNFKTNQLSHYNNQIYTLAHISDKNFWLDILRKWSLFLVRETYFYWDHIKSCLNYN